MSISAFTTTWVAADGDYRFSSPTLTLCMPDAQTVRMDLDAWRALREVLHLLGTSDSSLPPARSGPANRGRPWSAEEEDRLRAAWDAGDDPPDIARALSRSRGAVLARAVKLGLVGADEVGLRFTEPRADGQSSGPLGPGAPSGAPSMRASPAST